MKKQTGFTLIELVMVIVILGILAAVALPKFVDLKGDAQAAAAKGMSGAIASSAAIRYAAYQVSSSHGAYDAADACKGTYLQGGVTDLGSCVATGSTSCSVTCGGTASVVTLP